MRKTRLKLDELSVESFQTDEAPAGAGTVDGHQDGDAPQAITDQTGDGTTCPRIRSDYLTCIVRCQCTDAQVKCYNPV